MTSKSMKQSIPARPKELTPEEKEQKEQAILRQFIQKREQIAMSVLASILQNPSATVTTEMSDTFAKFAVLTADALLRELYAKAEQGEKTEE